MIRKNKEALKKSSNLLERREPSSAEIFDAVSKEAIFKTSNFITDTDKTYEDVIDSRGLLDFDMPYDPYHPGRLKSEQMSALLEALYLGFGAKNPDQYPDDWEVKDITLPGEAVRVDRFTSVSSTPFGFDFVQTRVNLHDNDSSVVPEPLTGAGTIALSLRRK